VFTKTATGWTQTVELKGSDAVADDDFGESVAISGSTAIVGAPGLANMTGRAYVFTKTKAGWKQVAELKCSDSINFNGFGISVAISGSTAVVAAVGNANIAGQAYVFTKTKAGWKETAELRGSDTVVGDGFGESVAVSSTTVLVGALYHAAFAGRAYVFTETATGWTQAAELKGSDTVANDRFGSSLAISGTTAVVGAIWHDRAYVFTKTATGWTQAAELKGSDTVAVDFFGESVAVSSTVAIVGAPGHAKAAGRAYVFEAGGSEPSPPLITGITPNSGPTDGGMPVSITGTNLSAVSSVYFGTAWVDPVNSCSPTACTVHLPADAAGKVNVKAVTSTGQLSNDTVTFTYGAPRITVSPGSDYTFTAPIGQLSAARTFEVTNSGTTDIELAEDDFVGSTAGDFGNASDDDVCASVLLAPKQTCPLSAVFSDPTVGVPTAELDLFDQAQRQVATVDLGGASTGPIVTSVTKVPQMADPVLVITGSGFGESTADLHLGAKTQTPYFELADGTNWTAGDSGGTCDATIDEWSTTTIIVTPDVGGFLSPCPLDIGQSLSVIIKNSANIKYSASTSTPVISTSGLAVPSVTGLSQDHGPQSGGGELTITGTGLSDVDAVEFGPYGTTDVTPSADGKSVTVNKVPSATVAQGVSVIVTTKDGLSSSPASSCWLRNVYLTYCSDSYFYLSEQKFSYAANGAFDNTLSVGPSGESGDDETQTGSQPPQQEESDSDDSEACAGNPSLSGSLSLETQGTAEAAASGQLSAATNGLLLSAMLGSGTLDITKVETTVTLSGSTSGEVDAPILGVPCILALYDRVTGTIGASVSLGMTLKNLTITFTGGFVNGQLVGPGTKSAGSFTITCNGQPLTDSNAGSCITFQPPTGNVQGSLAVSLWLQAGPDEASLGIGPKLTLNGSADSAGTVSWGACFSLDADAEVDIGPLHLGGTVELINPQIALKGIC
jgi:nucleoside-specific outer membrane channel protein Tsx